jgi:hypothetical protein
VFRLSRIVVEMAPVARPGHLRGRKTYPEGVPLLEYNLLNLQIIGVLRIK